MISRWQRAWFAVPIFLLMLAACSTAPPPAPTFTPRPTLPPREAPTAIPTAVAAGDIMPGESVTVELPGSTPVDLMLQLDADVVVNITAAALTDDGEGNVLDVVLEVIDAQQTRLVYDDDGGAAIDGLAPNDAAVMGLDLQAGTYTVRVNAFNGFQRGEIEVTVVEESEQ
ncbi:MAG: hypothetical protein AAFV33_28080 [Chloroflexota bacterium]